MKKLKINFYRIFLALAVMLTLSHCGQGNNSSGSNNGINYPKYTADHQNGQITFLKFSVAADGDCGLHTIERSRVELATALQNSLSDPQIQHMLRGDLNERPHDFPHATVGPVTEADFRRFVDEFFVKKRLYITFDVQTTLRNNFRNGILSEIYTSDPNPRENQGTFAAAAYLFHLNIRIWEETAVGATTLKLVAKFIFNSTKEYIDVFHKGIHFDRLVDITDTQTLNRLNRKP